MLDRPLEHDYWDQNQSVLGMDEAGRGPIAGPLMVAGVIFPKGYQNALIDDSKKLIEETLQKYPKDVLVPKFTLLNAFNTGKTAGKEIMILQLEQLMLNYAKTPEGIKAKEMLQYLKSDIKVEQFDDNGNPISPKNEPSVAPQNVNSSSTNPERIQQNNSKQRNLQEMQQDDPLQPKEIKPKN